jgi:hypothetical protein
MSQGFYDGLWIVWAVLAAGWVASRFNGRLSDHAGQRLLGAIVWGAVGLAVLGL